MLNAHSFVMLVEATSHLGLHNRPQHDSELYTVRTSFKLFVEDCCTTYFRFVAGLIFIDEFQTYVS